MTKQEIIPNEDATKEDALNYFRNHCVQCKCSNLCVNCDIGVAVACIEKQIPQKPIWRWDGNETIIECPNCGKYPFDMGEYEWARQ